MVRHRLASASHVSPPNYSTPRPESGEFFYLAIGENRPLKIALHPTARLASVLFLVAAGFVLVGDARSSKTEIPNRFVCLCDIDPTIR
jgi:hypothetical protein